MVNLENAEDRLRRVEEQLTRIEKNILLLLKTAGFLAVLAVVNLFIH